MDEEILKEEKESSQTAKLSQIVRTKSEGYADTMQALRQAEYSAPDFKSSYDEEISELFGKIINRKQFSYSPSEDPLYASYRDRYVREGSLAMRDTMGKAAALTGGYGSSYSERVGQEQYEAYLQKLNNVLPELYEDAYQRYKDEGDALNERYRLISDASDKEYERYRDKISDARFGLETASAMEEQSYNRQTKAYESLYQLILKTGYEASDEELSAAGMNKEQAEALRYEYLRVNKLLPSSGGGVSISPEFLPYNTAKKSSTDKETQVIKAQTQTRSTR